MAKSHDSIYINQVYLHNKSTNLSFADKSRDIMLYVDLKVDKSGFPHYADIICR